MSVMVMGKGSGFAMRPLASRFAFASWGDVGSQFLTPGHQSSRPHKLLGDDERRVDTRLIVASSVSFLTNTLRNNDAPACFKCSGSGLGLAQMLRVLQVPVEGSTTYCDHLEESSSVSPHYVRPWSKNARVTPWLPNRTVGFDQRSWTELPMGGLEFYGAGHLVDDLEQRCS